MTFALLNLPAEIREQIYRELLSSANAKVYPPSHVDEPAYYRFHLGILRTSRLVYQEAIKVFQDNIFILIATPWLASIEHVNSEGKVPIITKGEKAATFDAYHLRISIDAAETLETDGDPVVSMITCLEDLPSFTQMWRYSDLHYRQNLNPYLRLQLTIQNPRLLTQKLPKALQEQLLLPFADVKNLGALKIDGANLLPSVRSHLSELQKLQEPSPVECIERGYELKDQGNTALSAGEPAKALRLYLSAFAAILITVQGRKRTVHADGYFCQDIQSGPFIGHRADFFRMVLRVKLVANIVQAYLNLHQYTEAHFWGKRTVVLFRQSMTGQGLEEMAGEPNVFNSTINLNVDNSDIDILTGIPHPTPATPNTTTSNSNPSMERMFLQYLAATQFPARVEMGKIFYRTALAARAIGKVADVRTLIRAAAVYLPNDETVQLEKQKIDSIEDG